VEIRFPEDRELEKCIIGSIFANGSNALEAVRHLDSTDFYYPEYATIFAAAQEIAAEGREVDMLVVASKLRPEMKTEIVNAVSYAFLPNQMGEQVRRLKEMSNARQIVRTCHSVMVAAANMDDPEKSLANAVSHLMNLTTAENRKEYSITSLVDSRLAHVEEPEEYFTIQGFQGLHLFPGDLMVVGGRPGAGKTAFALQQALGWSDDAPVMFYSYEMTAKQIADRVISNLTGISVEQIEQGVTPELVDVAMSFADESFMCKDLTVKVAAGMSNAELFADMYRFAAKGGKIVVIDYLQLAADKGGKGLVHDVTMFSNKLRRVALDSGLLVVAVAQLNRDSVERDSVKLPIMSDLRESGAIEQDATQICLLTSVPNPKTSAAGIKFLNTLPTNMVFSSDDLDAGTGDPDDDKVLVVVDFVKVRQGKRRRWPYIFDGSCMRFAPIPRHQYIPPVPKDIPNDSKDAAEMRLAV
jgi:replicative DNA helicase